MSRRNIPSGLIASKSHVFSATKSEQFLANLASLGCTVQQHKLKPQHLDYVYDDKESAGFMEALRTGIKPKNCIPPKDLLRFKRLEAGNEIIRGEDLASKVSKIQKLQSARAERLERQIVEREEFRRKIEEKEANIEKVEAYLGKIDDTILAGKIDEPRRNDDLGKNEDMQAQREAVISSFQELCTIVQRAQEEYECYNDQATEEESVYGLDWDEMIFLWDELMALTQKCIEQCGNNILLEDDEASSTVGENIKRMFHQFGQDVDRLKHVVIYACIRKTQLTTRVFVRKALVRKIRPLMGIAKRNSRSDPLYQRKIKDDLVTAIGLKKETLRKLKIKKLNTIRRFLAHRFTEQIDLLANFVLFEKTKLYRVVRFTLGILTNLRAQLFVLEQIMKTEGRTRLELGDEIGKSYSELAMITKDGYISVNPESVKNLERRFSPTDKALVDHLRMFEIPPTILLCFQSTWNNLAWVREENIQNRNLVLASNSEEVSQNISGAKGRGKILSNRWDSLKLEHFENSNQSKTIRESEGRQEIVKKEMKFYADNKNQIIKESIQRKLGVIQEMKAQLWKIKMERAKLEENRRNSRAGPF